MSLAEKENRNTLPEGYRLTELGPLPEEWQVVRLGKVALFETGKREKGGAKSKGDIISIGCEHITDDGRLNLSQPKYISRTFYNQLKKGKVKPGDVLICKDGAKTGKSAFIDNPTTELAVNEHIFIIRPIDSSLLFPRFLAYWLLSEYAWTQIHYAYHGLIGGINQDDIRSFILPLPPLSEQRAIAAVLRTVQEAKEATEKVIAAARELKKSLMRHLFTYGPVPIDQIDRVSLRETELGPLPEEWQVVRLEDVRSKGIVWVRNGFPEGQFNEEGKGIPHLRPFNVNNEGQISLNQVKYVQRCPDDSYQLRKGDIVFNNTNSEDLVGKVAYFELEGMYVLSNHMTIIRVQNPESMDAQYLASWLFQLWRVGFTQSLARRHVNQASISLARLDEIPIPLPPLSEQHKIAHILKVVDEKIRAEEQKKEALESLFKSLLHNLMTARIRLPKEFVSRFEKET